MKLQGLEQQHTAPATEHTHGQPTDSPIIADGKRKLQETGSSSAKRAQPAKHKSPESSREQPAKRMQRAATPASSSKASMPAEGHQTAGKARIARGKQEKIPDATGHQSKKSKWAKYISSLKPAKPARVAPSGQSGKHKQRDCSWDGLLADDMLQRLQGAIEHFNGAKASYSILLE